MSEIHADWHRAAEHVLKGKVRSLVTFSEFRQLMGGERINYINDDDMLVLFHQHVTPEYRFQYDDEGADEDLPPPNRDDLIERIRTDRRDVLDRLAQFKRETKPPLSRRAKKALRRAKRRFRHHA